MLTLFRMNGVLHALCKVNLKKPISFNGKMFDKSLEGEDQYIEVDAVMAILTENGAIRIFNGEKFVKYRLGEFSDLVIKKDYAVYDIEEKISTDTEIEDKIEVVEEPSVDEQEFEEADEESTDDQKENKKRRHKNNNQQGGDK